MTEKRLQNLTAHRLRRGVSMDDIVREVQRTEAREARRFAKPTTPATRHRRDTTHVTRLPIATVRRGWWGWLKGLIGYA